MNVGKVIIDDPEPDGGVTSEDVHPKLCAYLDALLATGLYGRNSADVAVRLIERGVREAIEQRIIRPKRKPARVG